MASDPASDAAFGIKRYTLSSSSPAAVRLFYSARKTPSNDAVRFCTLLSVDRGTPPYQPGGIDLMASSVAVQNFAGAAAIQPTTASPSCREGESTLPASIAYKSRQDFAVRTAGPQRTESQIGGRVSTPPQCRR
jgi:hypothetical protein